MCSCLYLSFLSISVSQPVCLSVSSSALSPNLNLSASSLLDLLTLCSRFCADYPVYVTSRPTHVLSVGLELSVPVFIHRFIMICPLLSSNICLSLYSCLGVCLRLSASIRQYGSSPLNMYVFSSSPRSFNTLKITFQYLKKNKTKTKTKTKKQHFVIHNGEFLRNVIQFMIH